MHAYISLSYFQFIGVTKFSLSIEKSMNYMMKIENKKSHSEYNLEVICHYWTDY